MIDREQANFRRLDERLAELQAITLVQRSLRLGLRAAWLALGGILLAWGASRLWGWPTELWHWLLAGMLLGSLPLIALAAALLPRRRWVWRVDRRLALKEQVSTAWEVAQSGQAGGLRSELVADVVRLLPGLRERVWQRGWFLERDLVSLAIVTLLAGAVLLVSINQPFPGINAAPPPAAPSISALRPPSQQQIPQPQAQPGQQNAPSGSAPGEGSQPGQDAEGSGEGQGQGGQGSDPQALGRALENLGRQLSGEAPTYDLGQSLESGDLEGAAGALEDLSGQLDQLSPETRQKLAEAMQDAAGEVESAGEQGLADDLREAARELQGGEAGQAGENQPGEAAGEALDELAQDLRDLAGQTPGAAAASPGAGEGSTRGQGRPEPAERLDGGGEDLELPLEQDSDESGLLSPAPPGEAGDGTVSGSLDAPSGSGSDSASNPLVPNTFGWKWRDVVSSYFSR